MKKFISFVAFSLMGAMALSSVACSEDEPKEENLWDVPSEDQIITIEPSYAVSELKVMSFNILTNGNSGTDNNWDKRKDVIIDMINEEVPAIFGLQESRKSQVDYLAENLMNYKYIAVSREDGGENSPGERTAVFYNTDLVELMEIDGEAHHTLWLSETPTQPSIGWNDGPAELNGSFLSRYKRTYTWALFRVKETDAEVLFFNTHLEYGHHVDIFQKPRTESIKQILEKLKQVTTPKRAVVFCGDMNQAYGHEMFNPLYDWGMFDSREKAEEYVSLANLWGNTWSDYGQAEAEDDPKLSNIPDKNRHVEDTKVNIRQIDYIFVKNCNVKFHKILNDEKWRNNGYYLSDHHPVTATISWGDIRPGE